MRVAEDDEGMVGREREGGGEEQTENLDGTIIGFWGIVDTKYMYGMCN
jgi:hypothetical protein